MNASTDQNLIDEAELRSALAPLRPRSDAFKQQVETKINEALTRPDLDDESIEMSSWLQAAAALIPLPLLGKTSISASSAIGSASLTSLSFSQKLIAIAASPAAGLLIMIAGTIWAVLKIFRSTRDQSSHRVDSELLQTVITRWWRQFGAFLVIALLLCVVLSWMGYFVPIFALLMASGALLVMLISRLGSMHLLDRVSMGGTLAGSLFILAQLGGLFGTMTRSYPLLDQSLVQAVLIAGGAIVFLIAAPTVPGPYLRPLSKITRLAFVAMVLPIIGWFSVSWWNPIGTDEMVEYVESFDHAQFSSASWKQWETVASWFKQSAIEADTEKPHQLMLRELSEAKPNSHIIHSGLTSGLIAPGDITDSVIDTHAIGIFSLNRRETPFVSLVPQTGNQIRIMVLQKNLSDDQRDLIAVRLMRSWDSIEVKPFGYYMDDRLEIVRLLSLIDRPMDIDTARPAMHELLTQAHRPGFHFGGRHGGFASAPDLEASNTNATQTAVELIQVFGLPDGINPSAVRSFLRPRLDDQWRLSDSCPRLATLQRFESLPSVPKLTWRDYLHSEQILILVTILAILCIAATLATDDKRIVPVDTAL